MKSEPTVWQLSWLIEQDKYKPHPDLDTNKNVENEEKVIKKKTRKLCTIYLLIYKYLY